MKNKVYIMDNEEQEQNILTKLENEGCVWYSDSTKPTEYIPSKHFIIGEKFPTAIVKMFNNRIMYETNYEDGNIKQDEEIIYDGRKREEEQMSEKYVVSQEFMNELNEWKDTLDSNDYEYKPLVSWVNIKNLPETIYIWLGDDVPDEENNNRLITILRWVNGEDVFEVEKPKKWVVRSEERDNDGAYQYVRVLKNSPHIDMMYTINLATFFDTKEEAKSWANAHQEVLEVEV